MCLFAYYSFILAQTKDQIYKMTRRFKSISFKCYAVVGC